MRSERSRRGRTWTHRALGLVVPAVLLATWAALSASGALPPTRLPSPATVLEAVTRFVLPREGRETLPGVVPFAGAAWQHLSASLARWLTSYALALAGGLVLGLGLGLSRRVADLLDPLVQALRAIPIYAWLPIAIAWFGIGEGAARYVVLLGAFFPITIATADSVRRVPAAYAETARMLGAPRRALGHRVYLPAAAPGIVTGMRLGLTLGWMSVIVGEIQGVRYGVGAMMFASRESGRLDQVIVGMLVFALVGLVGDLGLRAATAPLVRWSDR